MRRERIRSTHSWRNAGPRCECALVVEDETKPGIKGLMPVRVKLFFSFVHQGKVYPCALVDWFKKYSAHPDKETGMWKVRPHMVGRRRSEEHTSELQSHSDLVCRLLLEKKKTIPDKTHRSDTRRES